jgi:predicted DNA repair protein MutK
MATSLLALLDDIATVLDDVAVMTKVAAGRTAGVLGDDLALNAEQVSGVRAERELPVVWAVFKGSARNKLILVPAALLLAVFAPFVIPPLLILGGCYLCYEGFEKISEKFLHRAESDIENEQLLAALHDPEVDLVAFENEKIKGAIRTDFVLSAEIIVIAMGSAQEASLAVQALTVTAIAILMTFGVYGLVAGIVKIDDLGLHLIKTGKGSVLKQKLGGGLLSFAPYLMKTLTIVGTAAMFLVGGGIIVHGIEFIHTFSQDLIEPLSDIATIGAMLKFLASITFNGLIGIVAGGLLVPLVSSAQWGYSFIKREEQ